jgi:phosphoribosyl 1,2-cyclic phosphodiesterase
LKGPEARSIAPNAQPDDFKIKLWGVRGSVPTPGPLQQRFGGNTACLQVLGSTGGEVCIFDAGSGIRALGAELAALKNPPSQVHIFLTHFHWDHIQGVPYFEPVYDPRFRIIFHAAHPVDVTRRIISAQMQPPYFPVPLEKYQERVEFRTIGEEPESFGGLTVQRFPLHHPQGSFGYRIHSAGRSIIFATDHEHGIAAIDRNLRSVARDADLLLYDAQYTPEELSHHRAWGHSTWLEATCVARDAGAKKLVLFHHDPNRSDDAVEAIVDQARLEFAETVAAQEGITL